MTYQTLINKLQELNKEQLDTDVSIYIDDEYYPASRLTICDNDGVLDKNHPIIVI